MAQGNLTFDDLKQQLLETATAGGSKLPAQLSDLHTAGISSLKESSFPSLRDEEWKYTGLKDLLVQGKAQPARSLDEVLEDLRPRFPQSSIVVFENGMLQNQDELKAFPGVLSLKDGLDKHPETIRDLLSKAEFTDDSIFTRSNLTSLQDGLFIEMNEADERQKVLHVVYFDSARDTAEWSMPLILAQLSANTSFELVEHFARGSGSGTVMNATSIFDLAEGAKLIRTQIQHQSLSSFHFGNTLVHQNTNSHFTSRYFGLGANLARENVEVLLGGQGAETDLMGLYLAEGEQVQDCRTFVDHAVPHCRSNQHYRGILSASGRGVFNGKVLVQQDAQKTSAEQLNKSLLLSEQARADAKPQLEIFADDVKCSHGATVGQLDPQALFYLRSRGIGLQESRHLLTEGFAREISTQLPEGALREYIDELILEKLGRLTSEAN